ncbi:lipopolysaccharide biosynthesis protein [Clostridium tyrobutyricum]|uniref:lipopolysaccharide biosynthesis protein n=1 Tax=Clostridium tyrobutyricum TaxID=1519 RepID=UPI0011CA84D1|nr:oligosaccharide flippase family protein [Clostridium tyrobutyricum]
MIKKIVNKYKNLPLQVKASLWFLICAFLQKGISFITTPIFTRLLSTTEYGQYNVFNSWMSILIVIVTLNLYCGVYTRGLVKFENDRKVFSSSLQGLTLTMAICWTAVYLIFHDFWNQIFSLTTVQMLLMLQTMWTTVVFCFWSVEQRVDYKYRKLVIVTLLVSIAEPVVGIFFVTHANDKVTARILGIAFVDLIAYTGFFFGQMFRGKKFFSAKYWKHALKFNVPLIPHYLAASALNGADRIMIGQMVNASSAGIYSLAYSVSMIMVMFNTALLQTIEPWLYKKIKNKQIEDIAQVAYPAFILIAIANITLIAFAPEVVAIFAPTEYYDAIYVIPPVAMSVFFMFSYTFFAVFEFYFEKTKLIAVATSLGAMLNIILNYIFIKIFGYYAAGYTTLVCYMIYAAFHFIFMKIICRKKLDNAQPYDTKIYFYIVIIFMISGFVFLFSYRCRLIRYLLILILLIIAVIKRNLIIRLAKSVMSVKQKKNKYD